MTSRRNGDDPSADAGAGRGHRKERVLHTRVPEVLAEELKKMAEAMRVPVSNVVRTVLEDAGAQIGVFQRWDMYGPDPGLREIRTKLEGVTLKGRSIMLLEESGGDAWDQALFVHSIYRVRFYLEKLFSSTYKGSPLIERYQAWSCLQWNDGAPESDRIIRIRRIGLFRNLREGPDAEVRRVNGPWQACPRD